MGKKPLDTALAHLADMADTSANPTLAHDKFALFQPCELAQFGNVHDDCPILAKKFRAIENRVFGHDFAPVDRIENRVSMPTFKIGQYLIFIGILDKGTISHP